MKINKENIVAVRLNDSEKEAVIKLAYDQSKNVSDLVRGLISDAVNNEKPILNNK